MLREGLRAELPQVARLAARLRMPTVPRTSPGLAAVSALGVQWIVSAIAGTLLSASFYLSGTYPPRNAEGTLILSYAAAGLFAFGAARWRGSLVLALIVSALLAEGVWLGLPGRQLFCERSGTSCDLVGGALAQLWPPALGLGLGLVVAIAATRRLPAGRAGIVATALGLGIASLINDVARIAVVPFIGRTPTGHEASDALTWIVAAGIVGAVTLGLIVGIFARRPLLAGLLVTLAYVGPWSPQLRYFGTMPPGRGFVLAMDWQLIAPIWDVAAALIAIAVAALLTRGRADVAARR